MATVQLIGGRTFQAHADMSLLDAATNAGIVLPYSCRNGRCGTCKAKIRSGQTHQILDEIGLSPDALDDGWILTCARAIQSDIELEVDDLGDVTIPTPRTLACRVLRLERLTSDVIRVVLRLPPSTVFDYIPGQYIDVIGPNSIRRSYSLASAGVGEVALELQIRKVEGGAMSQYWFNQAKVGDLLRLNGPLGTFFLRETANIDLIFLATGTGIAPVKAMLESISSLMGEQRPKSVTVLWGGRKLQDFYLDVTAIAGDYTYIPVLSRPNDYWSGAIGYIQDVLLGLVPNLKNAAVYACGSDAMIHSANKQLVSAGLPPKKFYSDAFVCSGAN